MPRWIIVGADRDSGKDQRISVDADSQHEAVTVASRAILIESVKAEEIQAVPYAAPSRRPLSSPASGGLTELIITGVFALGLLLLFGGMIVAGGSAFDYFSKYTYEFTDYTVVNHFMAIVLGLGAAILGALLLILHATN